MKELPNIDSHEIYNSGTSNSIVPLIPFCYVALFQAVVVMHNSDYSMWCDGSDAPLAYIRLENGVLQAC